MLAKGLPLQGQSQGRNQFSVHLDKIKQAILPGLKMVSENHRVAEVGRDI